MSPRPIRVAIVNDFPLVLAGIKAMLEPHSDRVEVVETSIGLHIDVDADVIMFDTFGRTDPFGKLDELVRGNDCTVIVFTSDTAPTLAQQVLDRGATGYLPKSATVDEILQAIEIAHDGRPAVVLPTSEDEVRTGDWPGRQHGLSSREAEILAYITQGLTNEEIAARAFLSINTVKTYIRTGYRKLGISRRSQAVAWGFKHGLAPEHLDGDAGQVGVER